MGLWRSFKSDLKIGNGTNYSYFENDGSLRMVGGATVWDDISAPATTVKLGANSLPDFDYTNIGLLFPQNKTDEKVYITSQMSHSKELNSVICLHLHFTQTSSSVPVFKCQYRFYNNGGVVPNFSEVITCKVSPVFSYVSGTILNILEFDDFNAPTSEGLSSNIDIILYRDDNVVTGDVLVKFIDIHYKKDTIGSREELSK